MIKDNVISMMTECGICDKTTTKKNLREGIYLCRDCNEFYSPEKIMKIREMLNSHGENWEEAEIEKFLHQLYNLDE